MGEFELICIRSPVASASFHCPERRTRKQGGEESKGGEERERERERERAEREREREEEREDRPDARRRDGNARSPRLSDPYIIII